MITKGYVIVSHPIDKIYLAVLEACEELKADIKNSCTTNDGGYIFEGKTAAIFSSTVSRLGQKFQIVLQPKQSGILIDIYDFYPMLDTRFVFSFFKALAKRVPLDSGLRIYGVNQAPTINELPTYGVAEYNHKLVVATALLKNFEYDIEVVSDGGIPKLQDAKKTC